PTHEGHERSRSRSYRRDDRHQSAIFNLGKVRIRWSLQISDAKPLRAAATRSATWFWRLRLAAPSRHYDALYLALSEYAQENKASIRTPSIDVMQLDLAYNGTRDAYQTRVVTATGRGVDLI